MPFQYQNYTNPYVSSISQLIERQGEIPAQAAIAAGNAQANAAQQQGQIYGGMVHDIGRIPQQLQQMKTQQLQQADIAAQIKERTSVAAARDASAKGLAAVDQIMSTAMKTDPDTGVSSFDRPTFERGLAQSGQGHLYPQYAEMLDKLDASAAARNKEGRKMLAQTLFGIDQAGYTPESVLSGAAFLKANHVVTDDHLAPILGAVGTDPSPESIKKTIGALASSLPEYRELVESETTRQAGLAKTKAEAAHAQAQADELTAKVAGTMPPTGPEVETARHNKEMERIDALKVGRETAAQQEAARHNRAMEAANNPLAALTGGPAGAPGATAQPPTLTGDAFIKSLPANVANQVKALAEGRMQFPAGFALKTPYWQSMISMVSQYDPNFDAVNYNARAKTRADFTSGKAAAQVNALNTVLGHLDKLSDAAENLNNTDLPLVNAGLNVLSKAVGRPNVTNFDTIKKAVADEVTRVWRQAGGSVEDIRTAQENLSAANSPDQLRGAIATYGDLLSSKLGSLQDQYKQGMGASDVQLLRPESQAVLDKIAQRATGGNAPTTGGSQKTLTIDQVKRMAELAGATYADAKKHAESKGYIVR